MLLGSTSLHYYPQPTHHVVTLLIVMLQYKTMSPEHKLCFLTLKTLVVYTFIAMLVCSIIAVHRCVAPVWPFFKFYLVATLTASCASQPKWTIAAF